MALFAEVVTDVDPATAVPTCPGWTVAKLLKHVGITQRWAEHIVRHRVDRPMTTREVPVTLPEDDKGYPAWLAAGGRSLVATLRQEGGDVPMWSWGAEQRSGFWSRRMFHECVIHRADAELALGRVPDIDVRSASDGVDELLSNLAAASWVSGGLKELKGDGESLHFHATDVEAGGGGEWMVTLDPDGFSWGHGHGKGDVAVRGVTSDLLLLLYGRYKPLGDRYELFGDRDLLTRWLSRTSF